MASLNRRCSAAAPVVLRGRGEPIGCVAISPDSRWLVTGSQDNTARLWDLTAKDPAAAPTILRGHEDWIWCVAISPDGRWLVTGSYNNTARLWHLRLNDLMDLARRTLGREVAAATEAMNSVARRKPGPKPNRCVSPELPFAATAKEHTVTIGGDARVIGCAKFFWPRVGSVQFTARLGGLGPPKAGLDRPF